MLQIAHRSSGTTPMIEQMINRATIHLPAMIAEAAYDDPVLQLIGEGWGLTVVTSWRVVGPNGFLFGDLSSDASDRVWDLVGTTIDSIAPQSTTSPADPAFALSSGLTLELFSLDPVEPWVFRIADQTWVASPTDLAAFD